VKTEVGTSSPCSYFSASQLTKNEFWYPLPMDGRSHFGPEFATAVEETVLDPAEVHIFDGLQQAHSYQFSGRVWCGFNRLDREASQKIIAAFPGQDLTQGLGDLATHLQCFSVSPFAPGFAKECPGINAVIGSDVITGR
jgi:hypothetical protein